MADGTTESWPIRCGRAEGALEVVSAQLLAAQTLIATLRAELREVRGTLGDLQDAVDEAGCADAVQACLEAARCESDADRYELTAREVR